MRPKGVFSPPPEQSPLFGLRNKHRITKPTSLPAPLKRLLNELPKTDLHMHLSGSTPKPLVQQFLQEQGWPKDKILKNTQLKKRYKDLNEFLKYYYSVPYHIQTPDHFKRATIAIVQEMAKDNVRYFEIRTSLSMRDGRAQQIYQAVEDGLTEGIKKFSTPQKPLDARIIVLAQRAHSPQDTLNSANLAVSLSKLPGSRVVGFDLAGSEQDHPILLHQAAIQAAKTGGLKVTIHAGETKNSGQHTGVESVQHALALGADRIGHGVQVMNDHALVKQLKTAQIPIEVCPWSNVQLSNVSSYKKHPLPKMIKENLNVSLSTDNRMMSDITLTEQLAQLYKTGLLRCWEQVRTLTLNGVNAAFISAPEKQALLSSFQKSLTQLEKQYQFVIRRFFCQSCPSHKQ